MAKNTDDKQQTLDAVKAAEGIKKEVTGEAIDTVDITINVRGEEMTFTAPASMEDAPADVIFHMEDEKPMKAFRTLLGEGEYGRLRDAGARVKDFTNFIEAWTDEVGLGK